MATRQQHIRNSVVWIRRNKKDAGTKVNDSAKWEVCTLKCLEDRLCSLLKSDTASLDCFWRWGPWGVAGEFLSNPASQDPWAVWNMAFSGAGSIQNHGGSNILGSDWSHGSDLACLWVTWAHEGTPGILQACSGPKGDLRVELMWIAKSSLMKPWFAFTQKKKI